MTLLELIRNTLGKRTTILLTTACTMAIACILLLLRPEYKVELEVFIGQVDGTYIISDRRLEAFLEAHHPSVSVERETIDGYLTVLAFGNNKDALVGQASAISDGVIAEANRFYDSRTEIYKQMMIEWESVLTRLRAPAESEKAGSSIRIDIGNRDVVESTKELHEVLLVLNNPRTYPTYSVVREPESARPYFTALALAAVFGMFLGLALATVRVIADTLRTAD